MFKRKIVTIGIGFFIALSSATTAMPTFASEGRGSVYTDSFSVITPDYVNINKASSSLSITGGKAKIRGVVQRTPSAKSIYLCCTLQKYSNGSWEDVETWTDSTTGSSILISESYSVNRGKYRVKAYYSVSGSNVTESDTIYSKIVTYN
jgi:hypothetical protein